MKWRILKDKLFSALIVGLSLVSIVPLVLILYQIVSRGISSVSLSFLVRLPLPPGETGGGISNALVGSAVIVALSAAMAVPLGVAVGIFLSEYRKNSFAGVVRFVVNILQGVPSIVIGIIAYIWVVVPMGHFSALAGGAALAIMMLPVVIKSTEETLKLVPYSIREASLSLGANYTRTVMKVVLPAGLSGILTGVLISIARVAGETAPLLFTAFGNPFMNLNVMKPMNSLPLLIFNYAMSPYPEWHNLAWGASFVLIVVVLGLNITVGIVTRKWKVRF